MVLSSEVFELLIVAAHVLAALGLVHLADDGVADALQLLHVLLEVVLLGIVIAAQPVGGLGQSLGDGVLVALIKLVGQLFLVLDGVPHLVDVVLELILGVDLFLEGFVLVSEFLGIGNHALDFLLGQAALVVGD